MKGNSSQPSYARIARHREAGRIFPLNFRLSMEKIMPRDPEIVPKHRVRL